MLIKGEKWACEACVRGHRVSNCQHSDRPLQHINKKGRPVSQCQHCRTLRKSRSAHVRCDCGEKAHSKGAACGHDGEPQAEACGCCHGQRCTCSVKKDHLDPVPESDSDETPAFSIPVNEKRPRARALTAQSEGSGLTVFANGHHKPVHKLNNAAHKCGLPYVVPRAHTVHGLSTSGLANRSVDSLPHTSTVDALHSTLQIKESISSAQQAQRMVKSEHGSPVLESGSNLEDRNNALAPLDMTNIAGDYNFLANLEGFTAPPDLDQPLFSAGLSAASIDWSHYDGLDFNNDTFQNSSYSQAASFTGFDFSNIDQPALTTTSTSGEISEVEDLAPRSDFATRPNLQRRYGSDFDASDIGDGYRLSTASSYIGLPQSQMLSSDLDNVDIDTFLKVATQANLSNVNDGFSNYTELNDDSNTKNMFDDSTNFPSLSTDDDNDAFWMSGFTSGQTSSGQNEIPDACNLWSQ